MLDYCQSLKIGRKSYGITGCLTPEEATWWCVRQHLKDTGLSPSKHPRRFRGALREIAFSDDLRNDVLRVSRGKLFR